MRMLNILLCAGALAACASSKSAERESSAMSESDRDQQAATRWQAARERQAEAEERAAARADAPAEEREERQALREARAEERAEERQRSEQRADERREARSDDTADSEAPAADNTASNERDDERALTALDQGGSSEDREMTQAIRKAVIADDSLSFTAKNVKIITIDGKVTLRGPVESKNERVAIGAAAKRVAGARVDNQLEVAE